MAFARWSRDTGSRPPTGDGFGQAGRSSAFGARVGDPDLWAFAPGIPQISKANRRLLLRPNSAGPEPVRNGQESPRDFPHWGAPLTGPRLGRQGIEAHAVEFGVSAKFDRSHDPIVLGANRAIPKQPQWSFHGQADRLVNCTPRDQSIRTVTRPRLSVPIFFFIITMAANNLSQFNLTKKESSLLCGIKFELPTPKFGTVGGQESHSHSGTRSWRCNSGKKHVAWPHSWR